MNIGELIYGIIVTAAAIATANYLIKLYNEYTRKKLPSQGNDSEERCD